jgi:hypothetical protein
MSGALLVPDRIDAPRDQLVLFVELNGAKSGPGEFSLVRDKGIATTSALQYRCFAHSLRQTRETLLVVHNLVVTAPMVPVDIRRHANGTR